MDFFTYIISIDIKQVIIKVMRRPSSKICYKPDEHKDINYKIIKAFGEEVCKELFNNPEGVNMPKPFYRNILLLYKSNNKPNYAYKTTKIRFTNDHCEGYRVMFARFFKYRNYIKKKYNNILSNNFYYVKPYHVLRDQMFKLMHNDNWLEHLKFDTRDEMIYFLKKGE